MSAITRRAAVTLLAGAAAMAESPVPPKVLLVVAHPDDEYYFAATVYRIAQEMGGIVDQVIITNGEGGFRYSALAEKVYGVALTDEATGRSRLPGIRKNEALAAGRILGIRNHYFLNERDERFTLDAREAINGIWNCGGVRQQVRELIEREQYGFVFTILPRTSEHGHHQAATLLALEAVRDLEPASRPVVLGAEPRQSRHRVVFDGGPEPSLTSPVSAEPDFSFDRSRRFGFRDALRYDIVVNWVIAEHKSQGMFQNDVAKHDVEQFWRFSIGPEDAARRTAALAASLGVVYQ